MDLGLLNYVYKWFQWENIINVQNQILYFSSLNFSDTEMPQTKLRLNHNSENEFSIQGYRLNISKTIFYAAFTVLTLGLGWLPLYWKPNWMFAVLYTPCNSILSSSHVLIQDVYKRYEYRRLFNMTVTSDQIWEFLLDKVSSERMRSTRTSYSKNEEMSRESLSENLEAFTFCQSRSLVCFTFRKRLYIISSNGNAATNLPSFANGLTPADAAYDIKAGLSEEEAIKRRMLYGENRLNINPKSIPALLIYECLHPFYSFQLFSVIVWILDEYYLYSVCIILLSLFSICWSLFMTYSQQKKVLKMTKTHEVIPVLRDGEVKNRWQQELVPGDIVVIPQNGCVLSFDSVLLTGSCIVNESMLTGESVPVTKTPFTNCVPETVYSQKFNVKNTLFSGAKVLQARGFSDDKCYALVTSTGFFTLKGELVLSIWYPKPMSFRLFFDAIMFVLILCCLAAIGFVYTLVLMINRQLPVGAIILRPLDIITIAVPPALPAALNIGMVFAQKRLRAMKIFCISPHRIDVAGSIDVVCFDKTGTLTEDEMVFKYAAINDESQRLVSKEVIDLKTVDPRKPVIIGVSSCHTLTRIDGEVVGDPMDLKLFQNSGWTFCESGSGAAFDYESLNPSVMVSPKMKSGECLEVALVRQFPFSSDMQRMAVIVRDASKDHFEFFLKGSPEKLAPMCKNLPTNFKASLDLYASRGYRVLALARKPLRIPWHKVHKVSLEDLETDLTFLAFLVFNNKLKKDSEPTLAKLHYANVRTIMVTGDNIATAIAVARDCSLIGSQSRVKIFYNQDDVLNFVHKYQQDDCVYALTGQAFSALSRLNHYETRESFLRQGCIFARMTPEQKSELVEYLQGMGKYVAMCGDGANDCGALKMAHVGISLSELEASAASPFTSAIADISCVDILIREGRASLVNSFSTFKFMGLYSMIQFTSVVLLYWFRSVMGDSQFLYIDLVIITLLMLTMGQTQASDVLSKHRPPVRLFNGVIFVVLGVAILLQFCAQVLSLMILLRQDWYAPLENPSDDEYENVFCLENATILNVSAFLYIFCALGFSPGPPHRKHFYTNPWYFITLIGLIGFETILLFRHKSWVKFATFMELEYLPSTAFKLTIMLLSLACLVVLVVLEFKVFARKDKLHLPDCLQNALGCKKRSKDTVVDQRKSPREQRLADSESNAYAYADSNVADENFDKEDFEISPEKAGPSVVISFL